jgi:hypothetical protein
MIRRSAITGDKVAVLQRAALQDERLSYLARGLLASILSRPEDWRTSAERLARQSPREGIKAIRAALRELEAAGYLVRDRTQDSRGRWVWTWDLTDTPNEAANPQASDITAGQTISPLPSDGAPSDGEGAPITGSRSLGVEDREPPWLASKSNRHLGDARGPEQLDLR